MRINKKLTLRIRPVFFLRSIDFMIKFVKNPRIPNRIFPIHEKKLHYIFSPIAL